MRHVEWIVTATYPAAAIRRLVTWAARHLEADDLVCGVTVTNCGAVFRGRSFFPESWSRGAWGRGSILIRVGAADRFPYDRKPYRAGAPAYVLADWREAVIAVAAHELQHMRIAKAQRRQSERECEEVALAALTAWREVRADFDVAEAGDAAAEAARAERATARQAALTSPDAKLGRLRERIAHWERKAKTAATWLKKLRRQERRLAKAVP